MMHRARRFGAFIVLMPVVIAVIAGLLALVVHGLWNGVLTQVVGVKAVTYWQALGLLVLARILVGGFPRPGGHFGPRRRHMMMQHWESLTPEQRENLRADWGQRGCWGPSRGGPQNADSPAESDKPAGAGPAQV